MATSKAVGSPQQSSGGHEGRQSRSDSALQLWVMFVDRTTLLTASVAESGENGPLQTSRQVIVDLSKRGHLR
jgi:hypothetical protein